VLRSGVFILLALAFVLSNSHLFAQKQSLGKPAKKTQKSTTQSERSMFNLPPSIPDVQNLFSHGGFGLFISGNTMAGGPGSTSAFPAATGSMLGDGVWSSSPALVVGSVQGPLVVGVMVNNQCPFSDSTELNAISKAVQPFMNYTMPGGWYVNAIPTSAGEMCCGKHLIVPIGSCVGKVVHYDELPLNLQLGAYYNSEKSEEGPSWQLHFQLHFQLP
jgi:hypothetical protein